MECKLKARKGTKKYDIKEETGKKNQGIIRNKLK